MAKREIVYKTLDQIIPYENNPRNNENAVEAVANSIKEFGFNQPIAVDKNGIIVVGHTRYKAAEKLGIKEVPVVVLDDLTDEQIKAYRIADNSTNELAEWNFEKLGLELDGIGLDMTLFGIEPEEKEPEEDDFDVDIALENIDEPKTKRGDIYQLGEHRLMCGDATSELDTEQLGDGQIIDLFFTDPPYNVDIGVTDPEEAKIRHARKDGLKLQNDNMDDTEFYNFLLESFTNGARLLKEGGAYYIWYASREHTNFENALEKAQLTYKEQLIWVKNVFVFGRQDYQWQHEPCLYGWKQGAGHYFIEDRTKATIIESKQDFENMKKEDMKKLLEEIFQLPTTCIKEKRPTRSDLHPTMKPITLCAKLIANSTKPGEAVLDLFGGSGSTLMACEQIGRKCYMMELDPKYCDIIIQRWEDYTGKKAIKL